MRASFLGCPIDILSMAETVEVACAAMRSRQRVQHVALNVAKFVNMRFDRVLAANVVGSDVIRNIGVGRARGHSACRSRRGVTGVHLLAECLATLCNGVADSTAGKCSAGFRFNPMTINQSSDQFFRPAGPVPFD